MKRIHIIKKLLSEGFTERTLSMLDDKQLLSLNKIMVNEQVGSVIASKKTPIPDIKNLTKGGLNVELREKDHHEEEEEEVYESRRKRGLKNRSSIMVGKLVENKYFHNFTSKGDIVKLIKSKLNESSEEELPDFLTSRSIKNSRRKSSQVDEDTKTKPTTKPDTTTKPKPKNPFNPGPSPQPGTKAKNLKSSQVDEDTKTKPTTKPDTTTKPKPKNPFNPGPSPQPGTKAKKR
jgi:hypothetical protein